MVIPVVAETPVERAVLLGGVASSDGLRLVELLVLDGGLLDLLGLLLFLFLLLVDLLDLGLVLRLVLHLIVILNLLYLTISDKSHVNSDANEPSQPPW